MRDLTDKQRAAIRELLQADIPEDEVEERKGMSYVPGFWPKDQLNVIFGNDGWSSETVRAELVVPPTPNDKGQYECVWMCTVRISAMGMFRDGSACGSGNKRAIGESMHDALGEAETDALKRAACLWGRHLGLALYDKAQRYVSPAPLAADVIQYGPHKTKPLTAPNGKWLTQYLEALPRDVDPAHRAAVQAEIERRLAAEREEA